MTRASRVEDVSGRADEVRQLAHLLEKLIACLTERRPWESFLQILRKIVQADFATLILTAPGYRGRRMIVSPDTVSGAAPYTDRLFESDPFVGLPDGAVLTYTEFVRDSAVSDEFKAFISEGYSASILGVDLHESSFEARLRLTRREGRDPFGRRDRELVTTIVPHFRAAVRLFSQLQSNAAEDDLYRNTIDHLALATIILDRRGVVVSTNGAADRLLASGDGIVLSRQTLRIGDKEAAAHLDRLLQVPLKPDQAERIRISRPSGAPELAVIARGVPARDYLATVEAALALFIADPASAGNTSPTVLRDLFHLTAAEANLAAELAKGISLSDAARQLGISYNTARSHLRTIFQKAGVQRQSQLVHLLRTSVVSLASEL